MGKPRILDRRAGAWVATAAVLLAGAATAPAASAATGTHYVDCAADSAGDGSSAAPWNDLAAVADHAFEPGDELRFKRGTTCEGTLRLSGSGSAEAPIVVSDYGTAAERAVIDGAGAAVAVHLFNQEHVVLEGLEVTNAADPGTNRRGIAVQLEDYGTGHGYAIRDVYLHDVLGDDTKGPDGSQGIAFLVTGDSVPSTFDDVEITGNTLERIDRQAINIQLSTWNCRPELGCTDTENWLPATGVVVRGNHLTSIGGDGIVMNTTEDALVEHNTIEGFNERSTEYNAGIWPFNTDGTLVQHNDVSGGKGTKDGMAYDIDGGNVDATFQYNLSHDNEGGFFLLCTHDNVQRGSVVRYNVSQNDQHRGFETCVGPIESAEVYNNTIYIGDGVSQVVVNEVAGTRNVDFRNNVVYKGGSGTATFNLAPETGFTFSHNAMSPWIQDQPANTGGVTTNPLLCNGGAARDLDSLDGYALQAGSPLVGAGTPIDDDGGRDILGGSISSPPTVGAVGRVGCA